MDITSYLLGKKAAGGGSSGLDWSAIGYSATPTTLTEDYNYAKQIYDNWSTATTSMDSMFAGKQLYVIPLINTSNITSMKYAFQKCYGLTECPLLDTSNATTMQSMFGDCYSLRKIPQLNTSKITRISSMFSNCVSLTDESLNNILKMCININPNYSRAKTLSELGFNNTNYPASKIQGLSEYQNFINAGWTIGY